MSKEEFLEFIEQLEQINFDIGYDNANMSVNHDNVDERDNIKEKIADAIEKYWPE